LDVNERFRNLPDIRVAIAAPAEVAIDGGAV